MEVEHFLCVFLEQNAAIHLIESHLFLSHLLSSETLFLLLLEAGECIVIFGEGMLAERDEAIGGVFDVLLFFQVDVAHHFCDLGHLCLKGEFAHRWAEETGGGGVLAEGGVGAGCTEFAGEEAGGDVEGG